MYSFERESSSDSSNPKKYVVLILIGVLVLLGVITFFSSMRSVDTGKIGVVTQYGAVTGRELNEGFAWVAPWGINNVTEYDIKTQKDEVDSQAATKDLQDVNGKLVLNYQLQRGEVSTMHQTVGADYKDKLILPALNEVFKAAAAKYTASELITKRAEIKNDIYEQLRDRLEKYGITVQDVSITNFTFSAEFNTAIEAVQIANQNVARARQELETTKVEAEKKIEEARGAAEAQRQQQETLTSELLYKQWIEKWDGKLPTYVTDGNGTILNLPQK